MRSLSYHYSLLLICIQFSPGLNNQLLFFLFLQDKLNTMARQAGPIFLEGTLDDITFYKMDGVYYARMKSRLTRKRVLKSPRFVLTRMHANQLAEASRIASLVYSHVSKEEKSIKLFRSIVGKAKVMLTEGKEKEVVLDLLMKKFFPQKACKPKQSKLAKTVVSVKGRMILKSSPRVLFPKPKSIRLTRGNLIIKDSSNASHFLPSVGMTIKKICVADP